MFEVGFWELVVVGIVALLVLGPQRLPTVARTAGLWYGKMRHFVYSVKADIDRELKAEELKRIIKEQTQSEGLFDMVDETRAALQEIRQDIDKAGQSLQQAAAEVSAIGDETELTSQKPDTAPTLPEQDGKDKPA